MAEKRLTVVREGACPKCKRIYDLETGNIIDGDPGDALLRYFCSFDGTILHAWN